MSKLEINKLGKDSMFQRIKASYIDDDFALSPTDQAKKERLEKIWALRINNKYSAHQTIHIIMRDYKNPDGTSVSRATAYRDYAWTMAIFGDVDQLNKAAEKMVLADAYWNEYQKAIKRDNGELAIKALNSYERLMGFDKTESLADLLKYKSVDITLRISPKQKKAVDRFFNIGVADFNEFQAEDIEYEELTDEEDEDDDSN